MKKSTSAGLAGVLFWVWMGDAFRSDTAALHIPLVGTRRYNKGNPGHGTTCPYRGGIEDCCNGASCPRKSLRTVFPAAE